MSNRDQSSLKCDHPHVLSLDGGGLKGIYSLRLLAGITQSHGIEFNRDFDLFAGSSVGGAICLAVAYGLTISQIQDVFSEVVRPAGGPLLNLVGRVLPKLEFAGIVQRLFKHVEEIFGDDRFGQLSARVFLPVYNFSEKSNCHFGALSSINADEVRIADVVKAICSDVRFMKPYKIPSLPGTFCDGGVFAYDPTQYVFRTCIARRQSRARILSIGSGIIENISRAMNLGEPYDEMFDAYLYEQFRSTRCLFECTLDEIELYYRISEFDDLTDFPKSYRDLVVLADRRLSLVDRSRLEGFIRCAQDLLDHGSQTQRLDVPAG